MKTPDGKDTNVPSKTPEEIKKGILCDGHCNKCAYRINIMSDGGCSQAVTDDALALIEQLERERDAAVEALYDVRASVAGLVCMVDRKDEEIPKWISVEERLPDIDAEVIIYTDEGLYDVAQYSGGERFWTLERNPDCWVTASGVTHWMPLPEPPKE